MYKINFQEKGKAFFIGIGGISMSGFAKLLKNKGFEVAGSDRTKSDITAELESLGIDINYKQDGSTIDSSVDFVVYTAAISDDNPEFAKAKQLNIPLISRATMIGQIMRNYKTAIGVSGTHGKTSTTSIASHILMAADLDPTVSVGGVLPEFGNLRIGHSPYFLVESCEYTNSFLEFAPTIGIILNIEADHLDFFKDEEDIRHSFRKFAELLPADGALIINSDIRDYQEISDNLPCKVITFSLTDENADYHAENISFDATGGTFSLIRGEEEVGQYKLNVLGEHNISNAISCLAMADFLGIEPDLAKLGLSNYKGVGRRFQHKGTFKGATIIDDYAHHPSEIATTIKTAASVPHNKLWIVFQPHTYTRTKSFLHEFADVLAKADHVVLADIYAAREKDPGDISSEDIAKLISEKGSKATYLGDFKKIIEFLEKNLMDGDLLITVGAGNVVEIGESLVAK
ncbi:MAG: UDP-N-acetylmuramate--L-alanine ligase [Eubacterium sp.]|nr:UDP-N-acetylmuramate--L-alanine ligase [Eubacterium sp.]